jgi:DNA modification methylase
MELLPVNQIILGHNVEIMKQWPAESIDCCITSPPYWGLRNYGSPAQIWGGDAGCAHEFQAFTKKGISGGKNSSKVQIKGQENFQIVPDSQYRICQKCGAWEGELGQEPTPDQYIENLMAVFDEVKRVIKNTGSCWVNLGDTFAGSGGAGGDWTHGKRASATKWKQGDACVPDRSLVMIPFRFAIAMVNHGWILRNTIIWHKPNCMPSSASNRFTVDYEYMFFFVKQEKYYFKQQFEPIAEFNRWGGKQMSKGLAKTTEYKESIYKSGKSSVLQKGSNLWPNDKQRNKRSIWRISPAGYKGAHFAVFPPELIKIPIDATCPIGICLTCGKPKEPKYEKIEVACPPIGGIEKREGFGNPTYSGKTSYMETKFVGYTECGCETAFEPGIVFDPFMGSGTTAVQANAQQRNFIGCEINPDYWKLALDRLFPPQTPTQLDMLLQKGLQNAQ